MEIHMVVTSYMSTLKEQLNIFFLLFVPMTNVTWRDLLQEHRSCLVSFVLLTTITKIGRFFSLSDRRVIW